MCALHHCFVCTPAILLTLMISQHFSTYHSNIYAGTLMTVLLINKWNIPLNLLRVLSSECQHNKTNVHFLKTLKDVSVSCQLSVCVMHAQENAFTSYGAVLPLYNYLYQDCFVTVVKLIPEEHIVLYEI